MATGSTMQFSDLARRPKDFNDAIERGPVTVTRRDGEPLVITKQSERKRQHEGLQVASLVIAASLSPGPEPFADRLRGPFPWVRFLHEREREEFAAEIVDVARACASVQSYDQLALTLSAWKATAEAYAEDVPSDDDLQWLDETEPVERPTGGPDETRH